MATSKPEIVKTDEGRLSYGISDACRVTGLSRSTLYRLIDHGDIETFKIGTRTLVLRRVLEAFLERQAAA